MASDIKLSVVVPCYKTERYLPRCLDSLLSQTLSGIEIICVNDGSPDDSLALIRSYEQAHRDVVRVVDKCNEGVSAARWSGFDVARGAYVAFVDSDDYVEPTYASDLYQTAQSTGADVVICGYRRCDESSGHILSTEMHEPHEMICHEEDPGTLVALNTAVWNRCFRSETLSRMHRLADPPTVLEDVAFNQLAYLIAENGISFTGTAPYNYMVHEGSAISSVTSKQVEKAAKALLEVKGVYNQSGASDAMLASLDAMAFLHLGVSSLFRLSCNKKSDLSSAVRMITSFLDDGFSTWRRSPYITVTYAFTHGTSYVRLLAAQMLYRAHLMRPSLAAYRLLLGLTGHEFKW